MPRLSLAVLLLLAIASPSAAQRASPEAVSILPVPFRSDVHLTLDWQALMGFGVRADFPITKRAHGHSAHDEIALSGGIDFLLIDPSGADPLVVLPTAAVQWTLALDERAAFYPELGLVAETGRDGFQGFYPSIGFGGRYYVWRSIAVVGRLGWPIALSLGATF